MLSRDCPDFIVRADIALTIALIIRAIAPLSGAMGDWVRRCVCVCVFAEGELRIGLETGDQLRLNKI